MRPHSAALVVVLALALFAGGCGEDDVTAVLVPVEVPSPPTPADLAGLAISAGTLSPGFSPGTTFYTAVVGILPVSVTVTPTAAESGATIEVNGTAVASGAPSAPIALGLGVNTISIVVTAPDGVTLKGYMIVAIAGRPERQEAYLKASNTDAGDHFGRAVAVDGDTIVIGASGEDSNATGTNGNQTDNNASSSGAAYVFVRSGGVWTQQAYLKASNAQGGDQFGHAIAIDGDTIVVGAFSEDSSATGVNGNQADNSALLSGAAYVFTRTGGVWSQQAYLKASNTGANDRFGDTVGISGDTIVVGAYIEDSSATGVNGNGADNGASWSGAAYVFTRTGGVWTQEAYLKASNTEADDRFGHTVGISGDTIVVGAGFEDSNATGVNGNQIDNSASTSGAAYAFVRSGGTWMEGAYLKASNTQMNDYFGYGYGVTVDVDTIVVGAEHEDSSATGVNGDQSDNSAPGSGAAYVFR